MAVGAVVARILTQYSDKGSKQAQKDIAKLQKKIDAFGKKALKSFAVAGVAAGAFAIKIGIDAVKGAAADEKAQTALALALRNTTSATEEAIAANTKFLDKLELQVAVDNDELIPALQRLATATGDLGQAQNLLILSTDVAVASGKDLGAVSIAISKAINGQFGALTKLGLPIDATALKQKDLNKILNDFAKISQGQASAAANTFSGRLTRLQLSFNQVLDKLGIALMPALTLLVRYIDEQIVPMLDSWISKNENELNQSLQNTVGEIKEVVKAFQDIYKVIGAVNAILPFGIGGWIKLLAVLSGISSLLTVATAIKKINGQTKILTSAARGSARTVRELKNEMSSLRSFLVRIIQRFQDVGTWAGKTTGRFAILRTGVNALIKRWKVLVGLFTIGIPLLGGLWNKMFGKSDTEILKEMQAETKRLFQEEKARAAQEKADQLVYDQNLKLEIASAKAAAEAARKQAIADALELKRTKLLAAQRKKIKDLGIKGTIDEEDPKQLNAAIALLERQKDINAIDKARLERMKEEILLLKVRNDLATRYDDILKALADNKITSQEVQILALKWGVATEAVDAYLLQLKIIEDGTISDDEIISLAKSWGSTQAQAAQYLDFFVALNDGILSDDEIVKLKAKWKLTEDQVRMYADFVGIVNDGKLTDAEIIKIKDKWKLTTDQVVAYIIKVGAPVSYSGTLIDPATAATIGWKNATAALEAYLALLAKGTGTVVTPPVVVPVTPPTVTPQGPCGTSRPYYNYYTGECVASPSDIKPRGSSSDALGGSRTDSAASAAAANAYAVAKAAGDTAAAAIAAAGVTPSALASEESGAIGAASIAAQLRAAEEAVRISSNLARFKAAEAADLAEAQAAARALDYDERFRFMGSSTMNNASSIVGSGTATSSPTIIVNVAGTVTAEEDLVQVVRNGLLRGQYNGQSITLEAI
jgi:hypothetical protein